MLVLTCSLDELRALIREEVAACRSAGPDVVPSPVKLVDRRELARVLDVSAATVGRLVADGAPHVFVGQAPRFDVAAFRAWLDERGRQSTKATPPKAPERVAGVRLLSRGSR